MVTDKGTQYTFGHELGHVLGLDHTESSKNLMFEEGTSSLPDDPREVLLEKNQFSDVKFNAFTVLKP
jgi:predicted Zn-dependent protease